MRHAPARGIQIGGAGAVTVALRRFGSSFQPVATVRAGAAATLAIAPDGAATAWHVQLASTGTIRACGL